MSHRDLLIAIWFYPFLMFAFLWVVSMLFLAFALLSNEWPLTHKQQREQYRVLLRSWWMVPGWPIAVVLMLVVGARIAYAKDAS